MPSETLDSHRTDKQSVQFGPVAKMVQSLQEQQRFSETQLSFDFVDGWNQIFQIRLLKLNKYTMRYRTIAAHFHDLF
jgi:hypothetical protein